jgi:hypothetical protein
MHAVVFFVDMKQGWEGNAEGELDYIVKMLRDVPGYVRGTWTTDGKTGMSFILFASEEAARGVADNAFLPPDASATLRSVDVYAVVRDDA